VNCTVVSQIEVVARRGDIHDAASLIAQYQSELTALRAELDALRREGAWGLCNAMQPGTG